jgi:serine protease Do
MGELKKKAMEEKGKNTPKNTVSEKTTESFEILRAPSKSNVSIKEKYKTISKKYNVNNSKVSRAFLGLLIILIVGFGGGWLGALSYDHAPLSVLNNTSQAKEIVTSQTQLVSAIANNVSPSVVSVDATATTQTQDIFGMSSPSTEESEGTGIIISSSGYVVTNRHVIPQGTTSVSITLADGTTINNVQVVGETAQTDPLDIAFLKINNPPEALQPALFGDSSKVQVGDDVVAIGNALGQFQNTVTSGIISGRGRTITAGDSTGTDSEDLQDLFQTDAAINEGNSGGPLVNINGQVIGINTAVASDGAQNIGFSIPINDVEGLIKGVLTTGKVERPYLGVYFETINPSIEKQYNLSVSSGAYIPQNQSNQASIVSGSPAAAAGLQPGDVITAVNGTAINASNSLSSLIDENQVGTKVNLTVIRGGSQKIFTVTIGAENS